jgi:hypothetical protein
MTIANASIATLKSFFLRIAVQAILTPAISRVLSLSARLSAVCIESAAIARGLAKTLAAACIEMAAVKKLIGKLVGAAVVCIAGMTRLMQLYRTLAAAVTLIPGIGRTVRGIGDSIHMAWQRVTTFVKSHGLRRVTSTTEPHESSISRRTNRTSIKKRGDDETDVE